MAAMVTAEQLRALLELEFLRSYRFELRAFDAGTCTLGVPFQQALARPGGFVSGPVYMAAADVAMWLAIIAALGPEPTTPDGALAAGYLSTQINSAFLSGARAADIECTARILKIGRRLIYGTAECRDAGGRVLTHHTLTNIRPELRS
jgi:acyl-coenzyme A thioesterase PaaI-like protein